MCLRAVSMSCLGLKLFGLKNSLLCVSSRVMFLELFLQVSYTFLSIGLLEFLLIYFCVVRTRQYHNYALQGTRLLQILHFIFWLMHNSVDTLRNRYSLMLTSVWLLFYIIQGPFLHNWFLIGCLLFCICVVHLLLQYLQLVPVGVHSVLFFPDIISFVCPQYFFLCNRLISF